jgi:hypothetical protein
VTTNGPVRWAMCTSESVARRGDSGDDPDAINANPLTNPTANFQP